MYLEIPKFVIFGGVTCKSVLKLTFPLGLVQD